MLCLPYILYNGINFAMYFAAFTPLQARLAARQPYGAEQCGPRGGRTSRHWNGNGSTLPERIPVWPPPMFFGGWLNGKSWGSFHQFIEPPPSFCWWFGSEKKHISMFWAFLICHINLQSNFGGNPGKKKQSFRFPTRGFIAIIISHI